MDNIPCNLWARGRVAAVALPRMRLSHEQFYWYSQCELTKIILKSKL
jgi:hypothetical protein